MLRALMRGRPLWAWKLGFTIPSLSVGAEGLRRKLPELEVRIKDCFSPAFFAEYSRKAESWNMIVLQPRSLEKKEDSGSIVLRQKSRHGFQISRLASEPPTVAAMLNWVERPSRPPDKLATLSTSTCMISSQAATKKAKQELTGGRAAGDSTVHMGGG